MTEEELARGVLYAINKFQQSGRPDFTLKSLGTNLSSLASEAASTVDSFKRIVSGADFRIAFQPILHAVTGQVHHYEALARFRGRYGEAPYRYITFAEETGLISNFDIAMAEKAIGWLAENDDPEVKIAINVSGQSATKTAYAEQLYRLLEGAPSARGRLSFEVTESYRIGDLQAANRFLQDLRRNGYEVCLDDFGAGAAGFEYLSAIEVDIVKIDGNAIRNAQCASKGKAFLRALATLCRELETQTVAEMIDSAEALAFIRESGIDYAQGYLFGKPSYDITSFSREALPDLFPAAAATPLRRRAFRS